MARSSRRLAAALLLTGVTALGLGACSPITTMDAYAPSDGVRGDLGTQLRVENLLILSPAEGAEGTVLGGLVNESSTDADVTLTIEGGSEGQQLDVPAGQTLLLGPEHHEVTLSTVPAPPGATIQVQLSTPQSGSVTLDVPVLDGAQSYYQDEVPTTPAE